MCHHLQIIRGVNINDHIKEVCCVLDNAVSAHPRLKMFKRKDFFYHIVLEER